MITLRPAAPDDLGAIVDLFWACWTRSYAGVLPAELIARLDRPGAERLWAASLDHAAGTATVAVDASRGVVGVTRTAGDTVQSLYVHPDAQGLGAGRRLLGDAERQVAGRGHGTGRLWVFEGNAPSRAFYTAHGWEPDGARQTTDTFGAPEIRLAKAVGR